MSAKRPGVATQLKNAKAELSTAQTRIAELEKKLKAAEDNKSFYEKRATTAESELEQVDALLDVLPGAAARKTDEDESWKRRDIKTMTRLAAYLANRS